MGDGAGLGENVLRKDARQLCLRIIISTSTPKSS